VRILRDNVKGGALTEVTFFILLAVFKPRHGYAIMQFIEESTRGRLNLGAGTLYGALQSLHEKGWIIPYGAENGRKKAYVITPPGREIARAELARLRDLAQIATLIIGDEEDG
jgi:DNA-binding PadR family transcriptional regulator